MKFKWLGLSSISQRCPQVLVHWSPWVVELDAMKALKTILLVALLGPRIVGAATLTVTNTADGGAGTLRAALTSAGNGDTINFSLAMPSVITLTNGELVITNNLAIVGPGATNLAISGNTNSRVFNVATNRTVS